MLSGYKTYIAAAATIMGGFAAVANGEMDWVQFSQMAAPVITLAALRKGVADTKK